MGSDFKACCPNRLVNKKKTCKHSGIAFMEQHLTQYQPYKREEIAAASAEIHGRLFSHNAARWAQAVTADSMSCTATHSSGPCALCSPQNRFGVGRPSSVRREPSVPPRMTWS